MEVVELDHLTAEQRAELEGGEEDPFGNAELGYDWRGKDRFLVLRDDEGALIARAGLLVTDIEIGDAGPVAVVGVGDVLVAPAHRRRGHAATVVGAAMERARRCGPDLAMLFCDPSNQGLYARAGFTPIAAPVTAQQPRGPVRMPMTSMWAPLSDGAHWPGGPVVIPGLPF